MLLSGGWEVKGPVHLSWAGWRGPTFTQPTGLLGLLEISCQSLVVVDVPYPVQYSTYIQLVGSQVGTHMAELELHQRCRTSRQSGAGSRQQATAKGSNNQSRQYRIHVGNNNWGLGSGWQQQ